MVPVEGVQDFAGQRLHVLQIGLGTYGTFVEHITDEKGAAPILVVASPSRHRQLVGITRCWLGATSAHYLQTGTNAEGIAKRATRPSCCGMQQSGPFNVHAEPRRMQKQYKAKPVACV